MDTVEDLDPEKEYLLNGNSIKRIDRDFNRIIVSDEVSIGNVTITNKNNSNESITKEVTSVTSDKKINDDIVEIDVVDQTLKNSYDDLVNNRAEGVPDPTEESINEVSIEANRAVVNEDDDKSSLNKILGILG